MESIVNRLFREGTRRGFAGSQPWMIVAIMAGTVRVIRRLANPKAEVVWRQAMRPGDRFEVSVHDPTGATKSSRRSRRKTARAAKQG